MLEILRRKGLIVTAAMNRFRNALTSELNKLEHEVIMIGEKVVEQLDVNHTGEQIKKTVTEAECSIEIESEKTLNKIQTILAVRLTN